MIREFNLPEVDLNSPKSSWTVGTLYAHSVFFSWGKGNSQLRIHTLMVPTPAPFFTAHNRGSSVNTLLVYAAGLIVVLIVLAVVALVQLTLLNENKKNGNKD